MGGKMLSLLLLASTLASASPGPWHYPRQAANSSIMTPSAAMTGTAAPQHNCSWSWDQWLSTSVALQYTNYTNITSTYTYYNMTASLTTECDGVTRVVGDLTTLATGTNTTFTSTTSNFTAPSPTCTPAPEDCSEIRALFGTYPCPRPTTGVSKACGQCSIWGGTVDLLYFPITATTSHNLCPNATVSPGSATICPLGPTTATRNATNPYEYQPCYYATANATTTTTTTNSGPYVVSGGHTFYQNRAYISLQTAYASDGCGLVGQKHQGTILEVKSTDVYSVGGYHHEFVDAGYQFNFQDLQAVPSYAYYMDCDAGGPASCYYEGTRYRYGTDYINGYSDIDFGESGRASTDKQWIFQEAYTPILLLPTQIRNLDPAWSTCSLNLGGLYDPPKALTQVATAPGPTDPSDPVDGGTTPQPGNGPTTPGPTPTALPDNTPTTTAGDGGQPTDTPQDPTGGDGNIPTPTTPNDPDDSTPTGGDDADPTAPNDPTPSDDGDDNDGGDGAGDGNQGGDTGNNGSGDGQDDNGQDGENAGDDNGNQGGNGDDNGSGDGQDGGSGGDTPADPDNGSPVTTPDIGGIVISAVAPVTTTQNVGGVIASIIGATSANEGQGSDSPAPTPGTDGAGSDGASDEGTSDEGTVGTDQPASGSDDSGADGASDENNDAAAPAPAPVTFTAADGSTQTISLVQGTGDAFVVGGQTVTAGEPVVDINGETVSVGPSGQVVVGTQTITADTGAGSSLADVAAPAATGSDGSTIDISTGTTGGSGVYVADGTTLSVGGDEQVVDGATLSAAPTGVVDVNEDSGASNGAGSSSRDSATGSGSLPQQTGNAAASNAAFSWLPPIACGLVAAAALR